MRVLDQRQNQWYVFHLVHLCSHDIVLCSHDMFCVFTHMYRITANLSLQDADHSWNKHTMSQNLRRMQYAVRGEVVIRADASK